MKVNVCTYIYNDAEPPASFFVYKGTQPIINIHCTIKWNWIDSLGTIKWNWIDNLGSVGGHSYPFYHLHLLFTSYHGFEKEGNWHICLDFYTLNNLII